MITYMCCPHCGGAALEFCEPPDVHVNPCPEPCCDEGTVEIGDRHVVLWPHTPTDMIEPTVMVEYGTDGVFRIEGL